MGSGGRCHGGSLRGGARTASGSPRRSAPALPASHQVIDRVQNVSNTQVESRELQRTPGNNRELVNRWRIKLLSPEVARHHQLEKTRQTISIPVARSTKSSPFNHFRIGPARVQKYLQRFPRFGGERPHRGRPRGPIRKLLPAVTHVPPTSPLYRSASDSLRGGKHRSPIDGCASPVAASAWRKRIAAGLRGARDAARDCSLLPG
jgi:hypothetical protein